MTIYKVPHHVIHPDWHYTSKKFDVNDRLYQMFSWCEKNIGKLGQEWDWHTDRFCFKKYQDVTFFTLVWA